MHWLWLILEILLGYFILSCLLGMFLGSTLFHNRDDRP